MDTKIFQNFQNLNAKYPWLSKQLDKQKWRIIFETILLFSFSFIPVISAFLSKYAIDQVILPQDLNKLCPFLIYCTIFIISVILLKYIASWIIAITRQRFLFSLRSEIWNSIANNLNFITTPLFRSGELVNRFTSDTSSISEIVITYITVGCVSIFSLVLYSIILIKANFLLATIALLSIPGYLTLFFLFRKKVYQTSHAAKNSYDQVLSFLVHRVERLEEIRILSGEAKETESFRPLLRKQYNAGIKSLLWKNYSSSATEIFNTTWNLILVGIGSYLIITTDLTVGELVAILTLVNQLFGPIQQLLGLNISFQVVLVSLERVDEILQQKYQTINLIENHFLSIGKEVVTVELKNIISYPHSKPLNLNFEIKDRIYLVGKNGAGKSTLCKTIAGLRIPLKGTMRINGTLLDEENRPSLVKNIMLLTHSPYFFEGSIRDNLTFGLRETISDALLRAALIKVSLWQFIDSLPEQLDYMLDDDAANLSRGQKLRLHCARAFLRNPEILILDEVILGIEECYQQETINQLGQNRKMIITCTSPSSVNSSKDKIITLSNY